MGMKRGLRETKGGKGSKGEGVFNGDTGGRRPPSGGNDAGKENVGGG
jgi:hypothetical protein